MKTQKTRRCHPALRPFDDQARAAQFANLRIVLDRVKAQPPNGELAPALIKMMDAGQIGCESVRQGRSREIQFRACVTPAEIRELLPLTRHPNAQALLRFFLEEYICISGVTGTEGQLPFRTIGEGDLDLDSFPSGVETPPDLVNAAKQWAAEMEVVEYLGVPARLTANGWLDLYVSGRSVEIRCIYRGNQQLSYSTIEDFKKDIVVVALPTTPDAPIYLAGWIDRKQFLQLHRSADRSAKDGCAVDLNDLFPMATLKGAM